MEIILTVLKGKKSTCSGGFFVFFCVLLLSGTTALFSQENSGQPGAAAPADGFQQEETPAQEGEGQPLNQQADQAEQSAVSNLPDGWYQNKIISSIPFYGLKTITKEEMDGIFSSYVGEPFTDDLYADILQRLYGLEYFSDIVTEVLPEDSSLEKILLTFTVVERPVVRRIIFVGNTSFRPGALLENITVKEGDIYNETILAVDERNLRNFYLSKGYDAVTVSRAVQENEDGSVTVRFVINEGRPTVISKIMFEGNQLVTAKTLKRKMELKEARFLSSGAFTESALVADRNAIRLYYVQQGYVDAVVENVIRNIDSESDPERNLLELTFVIREGERYTYGGTEIVGNHVFSSEELLNNIKIKQGDILNLSKLEEGLQAIADVYYENGYTSTIINQTENRDTEKRSISYVVTVVESDRSHVENILIVGNEKTKEEVIRREFLFEEGDIFSKTKLMNTIRNLYNLRYFSTVVPQIDQGSEQNLIDVVVNLEEQSTASFQFGVTFSGVTDSDTFPLSAFVQWQDMNFLGLGLDVSAGITASTDTQSVTLGYTHNWFLGSPLSVTFSLTAAHRYLYTYQDSLYPIFDEDYTNEWGIVPDPFTSREEYEDADYIDDSYRMRYEQWYFSFSTSTGYRWYPVIAPLTLRGGIRFGVVKNLYDDQIYRPADPSIRARNDRWTWENSIWVRLSLDDRDINYDPSSGWFASEQISYYGLFPVMETDYFLRSETKLEGYLTLLDLPVTDSWNLKFVFAAFSTLAMQVPVTDKQISETSKLYIDGMFIGRGWTDIYSRSSAKGNFMWSNSLEMRMPVINGVLALDFFFDAVLMHKDLSTVPDTVLDDFYFSFGPGLRFSIPQFPLRLLFTNVFRVRDGQVYWGEDGHSDKPEWAFVLSFNMTNQ